MTEENMRNNKNHDELFKTGLESMEIEPSAHVWTAIEKTLKSPGFPVRVNQRNASTKWIVGGIALLAVLSYFMYTSNHKLISDKNQEPSNQFNKSFQMQSGLPELKPTISREDLDDKIAPVVVSTNRMTRMNTIPNLSEKVLKISMPQPSIEQELKALKNELPVMKNCRPIKEAPDKMIQLPADSKHDKALESAKDEDLDKLDLKEEQREINNNNLYNNGDVKDMHGNRENILHNEHK